MSEDLLLIFIIFWPYFILFGLIIIAVLFWIARKEKIKTGKISRGIRFCLIFFLVIVMAVAFIKIFIEECGGFGEFGTIECECYGWKQTIGRCCGWSPTYCIGFCKKDTCKKELKSPYKLLSKFDIENAYNTTPKVINVLIRNTGTNDIDMNSIAAYVNDALVEDDAMGTLIPGNVGTFNVTVTEVPCDGVLKVTEPTGYEDYATIKC